MRHRVKAKKLGRSSAHQKALVASLVCNLIKERRIKTTLAKAKLARSFAEKMVTVARRDTVAARRRAQSLLRQKDAVGSLFTDIVPICAGRAGGYTRIMKLGRRSSDSSEMAIIEWVGPATAAAPVEAAETE
ncbi:MAG: 50S ribosomal protein L17 [Verrucomicrobia bacterium]|jgi:large subunit ribosomal protein L17|nr:50S ribosomal protein L17 [Verrucomicrobiota bacterium]